jgi:transcriptional regulator with XRE-family HTH domain
MAKVTIKSERLSAYLKEKCGDCSGHYIASKTGVTQAYIHLMMCYGRVPSEAILFKIAEGMNLDYEELKTAAGYYSDEQVIEIEGVGEVCIRLMKGAKIKRKLVQAVKAVVLKVVQNENEK